MLLAIAIIVDAVGWNIAPFFIPTATISHVEHDTIDYWPNIGFPVINVTMSIFFTTQGSLSVNNPVHVRVVVLDSSIPNLLDYYNRMAFTDAYAANAVNDKSDIPPFSSIYFAANATGVLIAEGDIKWIHEGPSWPFFLPKGRDVVVRYPDVEKGMYAALVSPLSDTLTIQNAIITTRLTFILIGFSFLAVQPILEAILKVKNPDNQGPKPPKPPGLWQKYRRGSKPQSQPPP